MRGAIGRGLFGEAVGGQNIGEGHDAVGLPDIGAADHGNGIDRGRSHAFQSKRQGMIGMNVGKQRVGRDHVAEQGMRRFHLIDLPRGDTTDLLAELLPLESEVRKDTGTLQQVAKLYLRAGSPARAEITYRALIKENPHDHPEDAGNYAGLGDAELAQGNYRNAEAAYRSAARLNDGSQFEQRLQFAETMAALDPTVRWLSSTEKYRRSMRILQLARDTLNRCAQSDEAKGLMADTDKVLAEKIRGPMNNELAEDRLALAGQLWETRLTSCGPSTSPGEESLRLVMAKLAQ